MEITEILRHGVITEKTVKLQEQNKYTFKVALEEYDDFGRVSHFFPASRQSHQLFSVFDIHTHGVDIEAGWGAGLTSASDHRVFKLILMKDL